MATLTLLRFAPLPPSLTRPSLSVNPILLRPTPSTKIRPRLPPISASSMVPATDRLLSVFSYTALTFRNALPFGRFLICRYPLLASLASLAFPFSRKVVAIAELVAFFAILFGISRNPNTSEYVRFNARQAMLIDLVPTLLVLVAWVLDIPSDGVENKFVQFVYGAISVLGFVSFVYTVMCSVVGRIPYLPYVSSLAKILI